MWALRALMSAWYMYIIIIPVSHSRSVSFPPGLTTGDTADTSVRTTGHTQKGRGAEWQWVSGRQEFTKGGLQTISVSHQGGPTSGSHCPHLRTLGSFTLKTYVFDEAEDGGEELGEAFEDGSYAGAGRHGGLRQLVEAGHQDGQPAAYQLLKALLLCGPQLCNHREANITALL